MSDLTFEHKIYITRPLSPGNAIDRKLRTEESARRLDSLRRQRWAVIAVNTIGNSTLAYTMVRKVRS
jgi:hypothetical protein